MSSIGDPAKLKVVELRAELSARGLDTKGNKPVLVKRLKDALEKELQEEIPDTSIAETSTEDANSSQDESTIVQAEPEPAPGKPADTPEQKMEVEESKSNEEVAEPQEPEVVSVAQEKQDINGENQKVDSTAEQAVANGENVEQSRPESDNQKPHWKDEPASQGDEKLSEPSVQKSEEVHEANARGDKRKRSPSPDQSQHKRSKSPVKEDEPPIDNEKVQLSWYDSDLHLQVDKENFLSARPYHEGAFGYAWAGVRATHGVCSGKVCFEVKITEELQWEDIIKQRDRGKQHKDKSKSDNCSGKSEIENVADQEKTEQKQDDTTNNTTGTEQSEKEASENVDGDANQTETKTDSEQATDSETQKMEVDEVVEPIPTHMFRVGWSLLNTGLQLGEYQHSFGYESSGRFVTNKQFTEYGAKFGVGDVIGSYLDITPENVSITFSVNGNILPTAAVVPRSEFPDEGFALFPHVLSRNYAFELNLGSHDQPWYPNPRHYQDYVFVEKAEEKIQGPTRPEAREQCEVIMMCGLPASGKTHWVREYIQKNPDKRYTVIGNSQLLEKMTVNGNPLKNNYKKHWNVILDKLKKCLSRLVEIAALRRRNYVIDQTNVLPSAQRRKMRSFEGFKRKAVVVVVGDEEQTKRQSLQEAEYGRDISESAVLEMKADMCIPQVGEWLEEVDFVELGEAEAKAIVQKYNAQGKEAGYSNLSQGQRRDYKINRINRWQPNRRDYRSGGYRDNRSYQNNRYDSRASRGWQNQRSGGNWNRNDQRNQRGLTGPPRDWRNNRGAGNWQQGRSWPQGGTSWSHGQSGNWNTSQQGGWSNQGSNAWKYGQQQGYSQNYGGGYSNYYYGQYPQNWNNTQQ